MRPARKTKHTTPSEYVKAIFGDLNWRGNFYTGLQKRRHFSTTKENKTICFCKLEFIRDCNIY